MNFTYNLSFNIEDNLTMPENYSNINYSDYLCLTPHTLNSSEFLLCYIFFAKIKPISTILELGLAISTILFNFLVINSFYSDKKRKFTCFDTILVSYSVVNGLTG